jgi:hypothetical protein
LLIREFRCKAWPQPKKKLQDRINNPKSIITLMEDDDVTKNTGIYEYLLDGQEKNQQYRLR